MRDIRFRFWTQRESDHFRYVHCRCDLHFEYPYDDEGEALEQCTGVTDSKGVSIFEGDILSQVPMEEVRRAAWAEGEPEGDLVVVEWSESRCGWVGIIHSKHGGEGYEMLNAKGYKDRWIVLGNVHQHGDLLKA